jgi:hypothetical protein
LYIGRLEQLPILESKDSDILKTATLTDMQQVQSMGASEIFQRAMFTRASQAPRFHPYAYSSTPRYTYSPSPSSYNASGQGNVQNYQNSVEYQPYTTPSQNPAWSRMDTYSNSYSPYDTEATSPYSPHPPSFILPNTDPMGTNTGNPYLVSSYSAKSQLNQHWTDNSISASQSLASSQIMTTGYALPSSDSLLNYQGMQSSTNASMKQDTGIPYHALATPQSLIISQDRTLPNPSCRYGSVSTGMDRPVLESHPLSATSQRSSLGSVTWPTDASSSGSHASSQTSCGSIVGGQEYGNERPVPHRESQDVNYGFVGYLNNSQPQSAIRINCASPIANDTSSQLAVQGGTAEHVSETSCNVSNDTSRDSPIVSPSDYRYALAPPASCNISSRSPSGQISNGGTCGRVQSNASRRDLGTDERGPDSATYQSNSNRASIASINNLSSY